MNKNDPNAQKKFQEVSEAYEVCLVITAAKQTLGTIRYTSSFTGVCPSVPRIPQQVVGRFGE